MQPHHSVSRRALLAGGAALCASAAEEKPASGKLKVSIFSKHLLFVKGDALAKRQPAQDADVDSILEPGR